MNKHFITNGEVKLIYNDPDDNNPKADLYDTVLTAQTPKQPSTTDKERAVLKYDGSNLFWEVNTIE